MKSLLNILLYYLVFNSQKGQSQAIDTLIEVGNHQIHFHIVKGRGIPILFENGAGDNETIWNSIIKPISEITGTTLITYDRAGFGKSTVDTTETDVSKHGIISNIEDLENGLKKLGYEQQILLVAHSYGGYLATVYSVRHPELVKFIVLIDVAHDFYFRDDYFKKTIRGLEGHTLKMKKKNSGLYYLYATFGEAITMTGKLSIPKQIPVIDFVNGISLKKGDQKEYWKECHKRFVETHPESIGITAYACHHYIWQDNPALVISAISKAYAESTEEKEKAEVYQRALNYAITSLNESNKKK